MRALPLNTADRSSLPARYQIVFHLSPIGLMFGSFVPLWFFARALAHALGIPDDAPVRGQPFGFLWLVLFLTTMPVFLFAGMMFGFLMNALILRLGLGWSWAMVRRAGVCPHKLVDRLAGQTTSPIRTKGCQWDEDPMYDPYLDDLMRRSPPFRLAQQQSHPASPISGTEEIAVPLRIREAGTCGPHSLRLTFSDGTTKQVNVHPLLDGPNFEPLQDPADFANMTLDSICGTVVWPNGADFAPEALYEMEAETMSESVA